jgi:hypothetical protein
MRPDQAGQGSRRPPRMYPESDAPVRAFHCYSRCESNGVRVHFRQSFTGFLLPYRTF